MLPPHGVRCCQPTPTRILHRIAGLAFNFSADQFEPSFEPSPEPPLAAPQLSLVRPRRNRLSANTQSQPNKKPSLKK